MVNINTTKTLVFITIYIGVKRRKFEHLNDAEIGTRPWQALSLGCNAFNWRDFSLVEYKNRT